MSIIFIPCIPQETEVRTFAVSAELKFLGLGEPLGFHSTDVWCLGHKGEKLDTW